MQHNKFFSTRAFLKCLLTLAICALVIVAAGQLQYAQAQSGRSKRQERIDPPPPPPVPSPATAASDASQSQLSGASPAVKFNFIIFNYVESNIIPPSIARVIFDAFMRRLSASSAIKIAPAFGRDMNRRDAMERAKTETKNHVIWLRLQPDTPDPDSRRVGAVDFDDIVINYVVFAPGTAEIETQGRVYYQHLYERSVGIGSARSSTRGRQPQQARHLLVAYTLEQASREAADHVMAAFKIPQPSSR